MAGRDFHGNAELGTIARFRRAAIGLHHRRPGRSRAFDPARHGSHANNTYAGLYALDTFDVTRPLSVTAGGRFNVAQISP